MEQRCEPRVRQHARLGGGRRRRRRGRGRRRRLDRLRRRHGRLDRCRRLDRRRGLDVLHLRRLVVVLLHGLEHHLDASARPPVLVEVEDRARRQEPPPVLAERLRLAGRSAWRAGRFDDDRVAADAGARHKAAFGLQHDLPARDVLHVALRRAVLERVVPAERDLGAVYRELHTHSALAKRPSEEAAFGELSRARATEFASTLGGRAQVIARSAAPTKLTSTARNPLNGLPVTHTHNHAELVRSHGACDTPCRLSFCATNRIVNNSCAHRVASAPSASTPHRVTDPPQKQQRINTITKPAAPSRAPRRRSALTTSFPQPQAPLAAAVFDRRRCRSGCAS